jgi:hypothetical protein
VIHLLKRTIRRSRLGELLRKRHIFGVGLPKAGTESIARLFGGRLRSAHEPRYQETIAFACAFESGQLSHDNLRTLLIERDRELRLDCEASHVVARFTPFLVEVFPKATFILTIREPLSWLDSAINQCINLPTTNANPGFLPWLQLRELNYGPIPTSRPDAERPLDDFGLHSLDGMLTYWKRHVKTVIDSVPASRLLVLRVEDLSNSIGSIARHVGLPERMLAVEKHHTHKAPMRHHVLARIPPDYLHEKVLFNCGGLAGQYYKEWAMTEVNTDPRPSTNA